MMWLLTHAAVEVRPDPVDVGRAVLLAAEHVAKQPERKAADLDQECIRRAVVVKGLAEPERVDIR